MIELSHGDIFESGCEALVSPVSCDAAQGAGLALAFAKRHPRQCGWYRDFGRAHNAEPGNVYHVLPKDGSGGLSAALWVLDRAREGGESLVLFATTKLYYGNRSRLTWVTGCLAELADLVRELGIRSVAVPMLGCGLGGLDPTVVRPLIIAAANQMGCRVWVGEMR